MPARKSAPVEEYFAEVTDPRRREGTYPLINFIVIAGCAVICGADDCWPSPNSVEPKKSLWISLWT